MTSPVLNTSERIVPDKVIKQLFHKMLQCFYVEERSKTFVKLGKLAFYASTRGHEKVQVVRSAGYN